MARWLFWIVLVAALVGGYVFMPRLLTILWVIFFIFMLTSPIIGFPLVARLQDTWAMVGVRRRDIHDLENRVANIGNAHQRYQLGRLYTRAGRYRRAIEQLNESLRAEADNIDAHYMLGKSLQALGRHEDALNAFQEALSISDAHDYGGLLLAAGRSAAALQQYPAAIEHFQRLQQISPQHPEGLYRWGWALRKMGQVTAAKEKFRQVRGAVKTSPSFFRRRYAHLAGRSLWLGLL